MHSYKTLILLFFLSPIIFYSSVYAQTTSDSLITTISALDDTVQVRILAENCWKYRSEEPNRAIKYGRSALAIVERIPEKRYHSEIYNYLGIIYGNTGELDSAYKYYSLGLNKAKEYNDSSQIAYSLNNIGDYYYKRAMFSVALENIYHANDIFEKIDDKPGMAYTLNDIGEIFLKQNDYDKALEHFSRSKDIRMEIGDDRGTAKSLINQAAIYFKQGKIKMAEDTYNSAMDYSLKSNYVKGVSWILSGLGDIYYSQKRFDEALDNRFKALDTDRKIGNKYGEIINLNQIGRIYLSKGMFNEAEKYLNMARTESHRTGHLDQDMISHEYLRELSLKSGNYRNAYDHLKKFEAMEDSIFSLESANKIADLQAAFLIEKKARENEILRRELEFEQETNKYLIIISVLISGILFLLFFIVRAEKKSIKKLNEINLQLKELNAQKDKMFSIIGHDLKNPAGTLNNYLEFLDEDFENMSKDEVLQVLKSSHNASQRLLNQLMDLLEWGKVSRGLIDINIVEIHLNSIVEEICELLRPTAAAKKIEIDCSNGEFVIKSDVNMITTVLRNFINNAIKFTPAGGNISVSYFEDDSYNCISTKDTGIGMRPEKIDNLFRIDKVFSTRGTADEEGSGLGLLISNELVKKCGGEIVVKSSAGAGSEFTIKLPKT
jgi:signal transduction histidine kinase